jgi:hypothetical protein
MTKKTVTETSDEAFIPESVVFDLGRLRARDMAIVSRGSKSWDEWASLLARTAVDAPGLVGDISDRETWLDLLKGDFEKTVQAFIEELSGKN